MKRLTIGLLSVLLAAGLTGCGRNPVVKDTNGGKGTLVVTVQDSEGPVSGANIEVLNSDGQSAGTGKQADEEGKATFEGLPAGDGYTVSAEHNGATGKQAGVSIGGEPTAVTITLKVGNGPGGIIAGTVKIANTERTLPGAKIQVVGTAISTVADDTGHYKLEDVPAGQQQIKASYSGYYDGVRDLAVKPGTSNSLVIELAPQSAGTRAQHTVITTAQSIVEVDQWHNPLITIRASEAWSAMVNRSTGNLLVADAFKNTAYEATERGTTLKSFNATSWMKLGIGGLSRPRGANYTTSGTVLVADTGNSRVVEIDQSDRKIWEFKTRLNAPRWAERLRTGNTLIADTGNNRIVEINSSGTPVWGLGDGSTSIVNHPTHVMRLPNGNTLVTDSGNSRVMEVNNAGKLVWMVGGSRPVADGDNLKNPNCAIRLPSGNTLIADTGNNRVIEVDAKNTIVWKNPAPAPLFADRL